MGVQAKQYYSAKFDHDLDPEIAYDLLGMGLSWSFITKFIDPIRLTQMVNVEMSH